MSFSRARGGIRRIILLVAIAALVFSALFYFWAKTSLGAAQDSLASAQDDFRTRTAEIEAEEQKSAADAERENARKERDAAAALDGLYSDAGFYKASEGIYAHAFDPSEFECGQWVCAYVQFQVEKDCPSHLYVEEAWERGGVIVNSSNAMSPALKAGDQWLAEFTDTTNLGESFYISSVSCQ